MTATPPSETKTTGTTQLLSSSLILSLLISGFSFETILLTTTSSVSVVWLLVAVVSYSGLTVGGGDTGTVSVV